MAQKIKYRLLKDRWVSKLAKQSKLIDKAYLPPEEIVERPVGGMGTSYLLSKMEPHEDDLYPEWSYLVILRTDKKAILRCDGHVAKRLEPGMLVELNLHKTHELEQAEDSALAWLVIDSEERLSLDEAHQRHKQAYKWSLI